MYLAMAEEPRVFTAAPWGYRVLPAGLIGAIASPELIVPGFGWVAQGSLIAACGLLFIYLRIRGATLRAIFLAVALVMATPSVEAMFANPFAAEPFALTLLLVALIAIEGGAGAWVVALALVCLSLSSEIWVLLLPVIFLREGDEGARVAGRRTLAMAGPAIWVGLLLRLMWMPQAAAAPLEIDLVAALGSVGAHVARFAPELLLGGLSILALLALVRAGARDYLIRHVFTIPPLLALPVIATAFRGEGAAIDPFDDSVRRLLIYALPFAAALAVYLDPTHEEETEEFRDSVLGQRTAMVLTVLVMVTPLGLDRYSRIDLSTPRDGPYLLGFARETLVAARTLDHGGTVVFDTQERKLAPGEPPPNDLAKLRFFLRSGFGPGPHYGQGIRMQEMRTALIVPLLDPRGLTLTLTIDAHESAWVEVLSQETRVGEILVGPQAVRATFEIPARSLRRGDNPIELRCEKAGTALPRLLGIELRQAP